jgi:hypothetical protein
LFKGERIYRGRIAIGVIMNYTKHQIRRIRDLNDEYFEVLFQKRSLNFSPGSSVTLYNGPEDPIYIASGIAEPWVRLIMNRDLFSPNFPPGTRSIKLNLEINNPLPELMNEESPNFVITSSMAGVFFSYVSTYPTTKCDVCYLGEDKISEEWIKMSHNVTSLKDMKGKENLYILGDEEILNRKAGKLLNNCTNSYLI